MEKFKDKLGRTIELRGDFDVFTAHHGGKIIGKVETTGPIEMEHQPDSPPQITGMFVDTEYQRGGIGLALLKRASSLNGPLAPARRNEGRGHENALTTEGELLTRRAQALGYVLPFPSDDDFDDD